MKICKTRYPGGAICRRVSQPTKTMNKINKISAFICCVLAIIARVANLPVSLVYCAIDAVGNELDDVVDTLNGETDDNEN